MNNRKKIIIAAILVQFLFMCCVSITIYSIFNGNDLKNPTNTSTKTPFPSETLLPTKTIKSPTKTEISIPKHTMTETPTKIIEKSTQTTIPTKIIVPTAVPTIYDTNAVAKCKDGTYSYQIEHQGSCRGHGGVETWYK